MHYSLFAVNAVCWHANNRDIIRRIMYHNGTRANMNIIPNFNRAEDDLRSHLR